MPAAPDARPPIAVVDAFTAQPFAGNPAGVCLLDAAASVAWMQQVAAELRHSETAFCWPEQHGWRLRWFTPTTEVTLCGHATLAAAHLLWERGLAEPHQPVVFHTAAGPLVCHREPDHDAPTGAPPRIWLDFPERRARPAPALEGLLSALGVPGQVVGRSEEGDWLVEVADVATVDGLEPDLTALGELAARAVIVTAAGETGAGQSTTGGIGHGEAGAGVADRADAPAADLVSRVFAPAVGVDEDPVTGSAHATLAPHWAARLQRTELVALQRSPRAGTVWCRLAGHRVWLGGHAVTVLTGVLAARDTGPLGSRA